MKIRESLFVVVAAATLVGAHPFVVQADDQNSQGQNSDSQDQDSNWTYRGGSKGVPGPAAGVGVSFLLLAGGYALLQRYRKRR
jgi:hypothetical protein